MTVLSTTLYSSVDRAPASVWEVMGLISVRDSDFYLVPSLCHAYQFTIHITKLKIHLVQLYSLAVYHTYDDFDSADPSSMQNACHIQTQLNDLAIHEFS